MNELIKTKYDKIICCILFLSSVISLILPLQLMCSMPLYLFAPARSYLRRFSFRAMLIGGLNYLLMYYLGGRFMEVTHIDFSDSAGIMRQLEQVQVRTVLIFGISILAGFLLAVGFSMIQLYGGLKDLKSQQQKE